jgi:hypothetical protein
MTQPKHPMQPVVMIDGVVRFKQNNILRHLVDTGKIDLNYISALSADDFGITKDDRMQLAQLIGYSISGYADLSYVSDASYSKAEDMAAELMAKAKKAAIR